MIGHSFDPSVNGLQKISMGSMNILAHPCCQKFKMWHSPWPPNSKISFPESSFPLTSGQKTRALGATISGIRHRCRLRSEIGCMGRIRLFPLLFQNGCSQSSRFPTAGHREQRLWEWDCFWWENLEAVVNCKTLGVCRNFLNTWEKLVCIYF